MTGRHDPEAQADTQAAMSRTTPLGRVGVVGAVQAAGVAVGTVHRGAVEP